MAANSETTKYLSGKQFTPSKQIKDAAGNKPTKKEDQLYRRTEYFEGLFNRPPPPDDVKL